MWLYTSCKPHKNGFKVKYMSPTLGVEMWKGEYINGNFWTQHIRYNDTKYIFHVATGR